MGEHGVGGERISIWGFSDASDLGVYVDGARLDLSSIAMALSFLTRILSVKRK
ncbi:hypothetical protein JCM19235_6145 [Vibrio maritimus]|uniref:Uncharacterized protein n=1 Tax=Vibrio maritimus TaxID=990268 RepID=A0A090SDK1_9VIBR|nr:hypothetical protein JCM19235_6145 [Vibrio maritimus]